MAGVLLPPPPLPLPLLLLLLPAPVLAVPPVITSVTPDTFATEGGDTVWLRVASALPRAGSAGAVCRLNSPPTGGTTFRHGGYLCGKAVEGNVNCVGDHIDFPATIFNATHASCSPPAVFVGGAGAISLSLENGSAWTFSAPLPVRYEPLVDIAIGRRPYTAEETHGALLLALAPRLHGASISVVAELPCAGKSANWSWQFLAQNDSVALRFPLSALPPQINNDLLVSVDISPSPLTSAGASIRLSKARRLMRTTTAPAGVEVAQVEHHTRALRVNGSSFVGQGWYVYGHAGMSLDALFAPVARHAQLGINMVMPYALGSFNESDQLLYLDRCHAAGVKVLYDMSALGFSAGAPGFDYGKDWDSDTWRKYVEGNVSLVASHPALLAFYICDDCCPVDEHLGNVTLQAKL